MKLIRLFTAAALGAVLLTGCLHAPTGGALYGFYDGHYGKYYGGFWGEDGDYYYYTDATQMRAVRDTDHHFIREARHGYYQVTARRPRGHPERVTEEQVREAQAAAHPRD